MSQDPPSPQAQEPQKPPSSQRSQAILLASLFLFAACGISYELILATISSYLFGDSVYHFSLTIGLFMSAMGVGAWISQRFEHGLLRRFLWFEWSLAVIGGLAPTGLLFLGVIYGEDVYTPWMIAAILLIGALVGVELPLLTRIYRDYQDRLSSTLSSVLTADYLGSLLGSLLFPLLLLPRLGLVAAGMMLGLINAFAALVTVWTFRKQAIASRALLACTGLTMLFLALGVWRAPKLEKWFAYHAFRDQIQLRTRSPYQEIVVTQGKSKAPGRRRKRTRHHALMPKKPKAPASYLPRRWKDDIRLYLNGNIQFSSLDEYRYHEALVHVGMGLLSKPSRVLILGGGDGLALREVLKHPSVQHVDLVDLDPMVVKLFKTQKKLRKLHKDAFLDKRVKVLHKDAFHYVRFQARRYDFVIIDLPDPHTISLSRLYSASFYRLVKARLTTQGLMVTQSTSPFFGRRAFWCIHHTLQEAGLQVYPYHVHVHSFGEWGFQLAAARKLSLRSIELTVPTRYLTKALLPSLFQFPKDLSKVPTRPNTMLHPILFHYYQKDSWVGYQ